MPKEVYKTLDYREYLSSKLNRNEYHSYQYYRNKKFLYPFDVDKNMRIMKGKVQYQMKVKNH